MRIHYNAPFCLHFTFACIAVFIAATLSNGWVLMHLFSIAGNASWADPLTYLRLLLHVLGHASTEHLFSNLIFLLLIGPMLEKVYGWQRLLALSLLTALVTGLIMVLLLPGNLLGASGVVFAFIVLSSFANARRGTLPLTFVLVSVIFIGGEFLRALDGDDQIAYFAHIVGGGIGGMAGFFLNSGGQR